ncbi:hypothetical protein OSJ57_14650 [Sphingomonas sp. HH69]
MTSTPANDAGRPGGPVPCIVDMSVLDLAIFMQVHRSNRVSFAGDVSTTIGNWFACTVDPIEIEQGFRRMLARGWLMRRNKGVRATIAGRKHGCTHLRGLVRMMDQGTRMLDVARMMNVLNLAMIELDGDYEDDGEDHEA